MTSCLTKSLRDGRREKQTTASEENGRAQAERKRQVFGVCWGERRLGRCVQGERTARGLDDRRKHTEKLRDFSRKKEDTGVEDAIRRDEIHIYDNGGIFIQEV